MISELQLWINLVLFIGLVHHHFRISRQKILLAKVARATEESFIAIIESNQRLLKTIVDNGITKEKQEVDQSRKG